MLYLKSKQKNNFLNLLILTISCILIGIGISIIIVIGIYTNNLAQTLLILILFLIIISNIIGIVKGIKTHYINKMHIKEIKEIVAQTKLPDKLPKVVYCYTTHNDFIPNRLLQNSQQTYENFEVWVSDGSSDEKKREEIQEFCNIHNFKYFYIGKESKNKADNINTFFAKSHAEFDYLMNGDCDSIIDSEFVSTSLKFFYTDKIKDLVFVSSPYFSYPGKTLFSKTFYEWSTLNISNCQYMNLKNHDSIDLLGNQHIISKKFLIENNNQIEGGCLEDCYTLLKIHSKNKRGFCNPLVFNKDAADKSIGGWNSRLFRIWEWSNKFVKEKLFTHYNTFYKELFARECIAFILPFLFYLLMLTLPLIIFIFLKGVAIIGWTNVAIILLTLLIMIIISSIVGCFFSNKKSISLLVIPMTFWALFSCSTIVFYRSILCNKYRDFDRPKIKTKHKHWAEIKWYLFAFFITTLLLVGFNFTIFYFHFTPILLVLYGNVILGMIWLGLASYFTLYLFSLITINKKFDINAKEIEMPKMLKKLEKFIKDC